MDSHDDNASASARSGAPLASTRASSPPSESSMILQPWSLNELQTWSNERVQQWAKDSLSEPIQQAFQSPLVVGALLVAVFWLGKAAQNAFDFVANLEEQQQTELRSALCALQPARQFAEDDWARIFLGDAFQTHAHEPSRSALKVNAILSNSSPLRNRDEELATIQRFVRKQAAIELDKTGDKRSHDIFFIPSLKGMGKTRFLAELSRNIMPPPGANQAWEHIYTSYNNETPLNVNSEELKIFSATTRLALRLLWAALYRGASDWKSFWKRFADAQQADKYLTVDLTGVLHLITRHLQSKHVGKALTLVIAIDDYQREPELDSLYQTTMCIICSSCKAFRLALVFAGSSESYFWKAYDISYGNVRCLYLPALTHFDALAIAQAIVPDITMDREVASALARCASVPGFLVDYLKQFKATGSFAAAWDNACVKQEPKWLDMFDLSETSESMQVICTALRLAVPQRQHFCSTKQHKVASKLLYISPVLFSHLSKNEQLLDQKSIWDFGSIDQQIAPSTSLTMQDILVYLLRVIDQPEGISQRELMRRFGVAYLALQLANPDSDLSSSCYLHALFPSAAVSRQAHEVQLELREKSWWERIQERSDSGTESVQSTLDSGPATSNISPQESASARSPLEPGNPTPPAMRLSDLEAIILRAAHDNLDLVDLVMFVKKAKYTSNVRPSKLLIFQLRRQANCGMLDTATFQQGLAQCKRIMAFLKAKRILEKDAFFAYGAVDPVRTMTDDLRAFIEQNTKKEILFCVGEAEISNYFGALYLHPMVNPVVVINSQDERLWSQDLLQLCLPQRWLHFEQRAVQVAQYRFDHVGEFIDQAKLLEIARLAGEDQLNATDKELKRFNFGKWDHV